MKILAVIALVALLIVYLRARRGTEANSEKDISSRSRVVDVDNDKY